MKAISRALHAHLVQGTVCKILGQEDIKPHKVRYYLERRDAEFEQKMAQVLCVSARAATEKLPAFALRTKDSRLASVSIV
jgi:hypothetical protein